MSKLKTNAHQKEKYTSHFAKAAANKKAKATKLLMHLAKAKKRKDNNYGRLIKTST